MSLDGDHRGFTDDVLAMVPALRAYAWTLTKKQQDVDDLVQDTLVKAIANIDRFERGTNLRAWLMTIMRNTFFNRIKRSKREVTGSIDCVASTPSVPPTQEGALIRNELVEAIMSLPHHYREVLILVVVLGESYEGTAAICGIAVGTVKSRVSRARQMVVDRFEGRGNEKSAAR